MASKTEKKESLSNLQGLSPLQIILFNLLKEKGPMTRDQLCKEFGFKKRKVIRVDKYLLREKRIRYEQEYEQYDHRSTIYDNLVKLQKKKLVEKSSKSNGRRGRPKVYWKVKEV